MGIYQNRIFDVSHFTKIFALQNFVLYSSTFILSPEVHLNVLQLFCITPSQNSIIALMYVYVYTVKIFLGGSLAPSELIF